MDSREQLLLMAICDPGAIVGFRREREALPHWQVRAILASDWLRDTLAAERRAGFIAGRDAAAEVAEHLNGWGSDKGAGGHAEHIAAAIRNLEPEANDVGS